MSKKPASSSHSSVVQSFINDLKLLSKLPVSKKYAKLHLEEYPFDEQLLNASELYRKSRTLYLSLGGIFSPRLCSTMRSLSAQDLFKDEIDYSPSFSEIMWFKDHHKEVADPEKEIEALDRFNEISIYHEQNHRVIWRLLPPVPKDREDVRRYLNFAESLVVALDVALGDQLGKKTSPVFESMKVIYRSAGEDSWFQKNKQDYRKYLLSVLTTTYFALELVHNDDILKAVDYIFPGQKKLNKDAVHRGLELSELFTRVTNPQWQDLFWKDAQAKLEKLQKKSKEEPLYITEDPLDLEEEFFFAHRIFDYYGI